MSGTCPISARPTGQVSNTCAAWAMPLVMAIAMLSGMKTTVSLDTETRDRLAALATLHGRTMGEQIAAMVEAAEDQDFWNQVSRGYADIQAVGADVVVHDDYPEYAHLSAGEIPAEGDHNEEPPPRTRRRRTAA